MRKKIIFTIVVIVIVLIFIFRGWLSMLIPLENRDLSVGAPNASMEIRNKWGKIKLKEWYEKSVEWIKNSEIIRNDIGEIKNVAPIGKPNYLNCSFTDGCHGYFSLEVEGDRGTGLFDLGQVVLNYQYELNFSFSNWKYNGKEIQIHKSGIPCEEYYSSENMLEVYSSEIGKTKENSVGVQDINLLSNRAAIYSERGDFNKAIADMEKIIEVQDKLSEGRNVQIHDGNTIKTEPEKNQPNFISKMNEQKRSLAYLYYSNKKYTKAEEILQTILTETDFKNMSVETFKYLFDYNFGRDSVFLWILQRKIGKNKIADENLEKNLEIYIAKNNVPENQKISLMSCFQKDALYILDRISESDYLKQSGLCGYRQYYYAGQKNLINGNTANANKYFNEFVKFEQNDEILDNEYLSQYTWENDPLSFLSYGQNKCKNTNEHYFKEIEKEIAKQTIVQK